MYIRCKEVKMKRDKIIKSCIESLEEASSLICIVTMLAVSIYSVLVIDIHNVLLIGICSFILYVGCKFTLKRMKEDNDKEVSND